MCYARGSRPEGEEEGARGRCLEIKLCHCEEAIECHCHEDEVQDVPRVWAAEAELSPRSQEVRSS